MTSTPRSQQLLELARLRQRIDKLERQLELTDGREAPDQDGHDFPEVWAYQLLSAHATDLISIHAPNGDYLYASPNAMSFFGWSPEELVKRNAYDLFHPEDLEQIAADHSGHGDDSSGKVRYRIKHRDGSYHWVETRSRARLTAAGVEQIVALTRDIEAEMIAERAKEVVISQHRMRSLSQLAHAAAHEINNPLAVAKTEMECLRRGGLTARDIDEISACANEALERIQFTVRELQLLSDLCEPRHETIAYDEVVERVISLLGIEPHRIKSTLQPTLVTCDRGRLYQMTFELLGAHLQSMEADEILQVSCRTNSDRGCLEVLGGQRAAPENLRVDLLAMLRLGTTATLSPLKLAKQLADEQNGTLEIQRERNALRSRLWLPAA